MRVGRVGGLGRGWLLLEDRGGLVRRRRRQETRMSPSCSLHTTVPCFWRLHSHGETLAFNGRRRKMAKPRGRGTRPLANAPWGQPRGGAGDPHPAALPLNPTALGQREEAAPLSWRTARARPQRGMVPSPTTPSCLTGLRRKPVPRGGGTSGHPTARQLVIWSVNIGGGLGGRRDSGRGFI